MKKILWCGLLLVFSASACNTTKNNIKKENEFVKIWLPFAPKRVKEVYEHSVVKSYRQSSDCGYYCPEIDIWEYKFKDKKTGKIITSALPIATQKKFWRTPHEARIIALSLYGNISYFDALMQYLESIKNIKNMNNISDKIWGFQTFVPRIYVAKRNPRDRKRLGELRNQTPDYMIKELLDNECEVAFVDNKQPEVRRDGSFWRFAVASEKMPKKERMRYLVRDVDTVLTAAEVWAVADWIKSKKQFHRMHIIPICMGPMTAGLWGGTHVGNGNFGDFNALVKNYPYRFDYGDDELFTRDLLWPRIKSIGSVLTHHFERGGFINKLGNPYSNSCEEPTDDFCKKLNPRSACEDHIMPDSENFGGIIEAIGQRVSLEELRTKHPEFFDLELYKPENQFIYEVLKSK